MSGNGIKVKVGTIDLAPSWESILPVLLEIYSNAESSTGKSAALSELKRMAMIADLYVAKTKREQTGAKSRAKKSAPVKTTRN